MIMCGHNPGLEDLALMLVPDAKGDALRDTLEMKFPTASLAEMQFDVDQWRAVGEGSAKLTRFIRPRDLDPTLGPDDSE